MVDISRGWHGPRRALAILWAERLGANLTAAGLAAALVNKINETSPGWPERHRMVLAFRLGIAEAGAP